MFIFLIVLQLSSARLFFSKFLAIIEFFCTSVNKLLLETGLIVLIIF